jgi:Flp pilus assembly pilin Flp
MWSVFVRLFREDSAQDLVEYALLASFIGLVCAAGLSSLQSAIHSTYGTWNTNNNNNSQMPSPGGS